MAGLGIPPTTSTDIVEPILASVHENMKFFGQRWALQKPPIFQKARYEKDIR